MQFLTDYRLFAFLIGFTILNVIMTMSLYYVGYREKENALSKFEKFSPERLEQTKHYFNRYGFGILLLTALPAIGAMLVLTAGILEKRPITVVTGVFLSKLFRNLIIIWMLGYTVTTLFAN